MTDSNRSPDAAPHDAPDSREPSERRRRRRRGGRGDETERGQASQTERANRSASPQGGDGEPSEERGGRSRRRRSARSARGKARDERGRETGAEPATARAGEHESDAPSDRRRKRRRRRGDEAATAERPSDEHAERAGADAQDSDRPSKRKRRRRRRGGQEPAREDHQRARESADEPAPDDQDESAPPPVAPEDDATEPFGDVAPEPEDEDTGAAADQAGAHPAEPDDDFPIESHAPRPEPDADDPDPASFDLEAVDADENRALDTRVRNVVGIKFTTTGRIHFYDSGDQYYRRGESVVVEGDRPARAGTVAIASSRRPARGLSLERGVRRASERDRAAFADNRSRSDEILAEARALTRQLNLPMKVFRAELNHTGKKALVYFSTEERIDYRDLVKRLTRRLSVRVELRQTGVRDEAKLVGGIGSCGLELCCSTWLPEFVPVSIKMAKDQGLVLNPTKVSGQCGRLKCCLVYEQETYAAMRKGLPKLGKRVITEAGEGRVVEVDVLGRRVRVALGPGEFRVFPAHEVKPLFPSQTQKLAGGRQK